MSNWQCVENVKNFQKILKKSKKFACYCLENELFTFSALDVPSNDFLIRQLDTSTPQVDVNLHLTLSTLLV